MRWMNLCGVGGGEERRWGFGGSSAMRVSAAVMTPWRWSLEDGEPKDCLCIVLNVKTERLRVKLPECRERKIMKQERDKIKSVKCEIYYSDSFLFIIKIHIVMAFLVLYFIFVYLVSWPHCAYSLFICLSFLGVSFPFTLSSSLYFFFYSLFLTKAAFCFEFWDEKKLDEMKMFTVK